MSGSTHVPARLSPSAQHPVAMHPPASTVTSSPRYERLTCIERSNVVYRALRLSSVLDGRLNSYTQHKGWASTWGGTIISSVVN